MKQNFSFDFLVFGSTIENPKRVVSDVEPSEIENWQGWSPSLSHSP
jgi:hypothetical protein